MTTKNYFPRLCDRLLQEQLEASGAVLVEGAKWCGKTSTAAHAARSVLYMQDPDRSATFRRAADTKPSLLLEGATPRLLDEWQEAPVLWDAVRFAVDQRGEVGQFILTGSAVPLDHATMHTGTGRIARLKMRPMSLWESQESSGSVSLGALFDGTAQTEAFSSVTVEDLAFLTCRGGWPAAVRLNGKAALRTAENYVEAIIQQDVHRVDEVEKNPERVYQLLRSLARNTATMCTATTLMADVNASDATITDKTLSTYLNALRRIFVVEDLPAWQPSLRSKTALRTSAKRHFVDPSIGAAVLHADPQSLLSDFNTFGFFFESLCVRDLRVYAQALGGDVFHYRDKSNLEADAIIRLRDGRWGAVEVKLGSREIDEAALHLLALQNKVDADRMGRPSFLMVLTGGELAYRRQDGVFIVPLACLKD